MPSKEFNAFLQDFLAHRKKPGSLQDTRDAFEHWLAQYPPPSDVRFEPFSIGPLSACWAFARGVKAHRIVLFFHGGGFTIGSVRSHWGLMGRLSQASGCAVLGINYRLAPENPYPAALEDARTAYRWLLHHPYPHNIIAFAGASAGCNLALSLMFKLKLEKISLPSSCVLMCPWVDLARTKYPDLPDVIAPERINDSAKMYCAARDPKDPFISPIYGNLEGLPPLLIQMGTGEILSEQIEEFAKKAKESGIKVTLEKWPKMIHTWQLFASRFPEGQEAIEQAGAFIKTTFH